MSVAIIPLLLYEAQHAVTQHIYYWWRVAEPYKLWPCYVGSI